MILITHNVCKNSDDSLNELVEDVLAHHRFPPHPNKAHQLSNVEKWLTQEGAWEIAKVI